MGRKKGQAEKPREGGPQRDANGRRKPRPIPFWQWALLAVSVVLMLGGGAAWAYSAFTRSDAGPVAGASDAPAGGQGTTGSGTGGSSLAEGLTSGFGPGGSPLPGTTGGSGTPTGTDPGTESGEGSDPLDLYSPAVFRLGFSFFAGFAMAYALRQFVKITVATLGVVLLGLFGLQYAGLIQVDWGLLEGKFDAAAAFLRDQTESFTAFVRGYLPSTASAATGAFLGFRRK
ncbi:MAG: FUN14 domain-containing protein [Phycisphaerales bacterium]